MADDDLWWEERRREDGGISDTERCNGCRRYFVVEELLAVDGDLVGEWLCMDCINGIAQVEELSPHELLQLEDKSRG